MTYEVFIYAGEEEFKELRPCSIVDGLSKGEAVWFATKFTENNPDAIVKIQSEGEMYIIKNHQY